MEGWQLALVLLGIAGLSALLVVPRAAEPHEVPVPELDRREQRFQARREAALTASAQLPYEVRAVGERVRRYGRATARGDGEAARGELAALREAVAAVRGQPEAELLYTLRAAQTSLFLRALTHWETTGTPSEDLDELGGDFIAAARANRWAPCDRLVLDRDERRVVFVVRWARLTGLLEDPQLGPTLNDWRAYYRFLLEHPELGRAVPVGPQLETLLLGYVEGLEKRDPAYPASLARGVVLFRMGDYAGAARAFDRHLADRPDGPRRAWATNYLLAASQRLRPEDAAGNAW